MRVIIISKCSPPNLFIVREVRAAFPDAVLVRPAWSGGGTTEKLLKLRRAPVTTMRRQLRRTVNTLRERRRTRRESRHLFGSPSAPELPPHELVSADDLRTGEAAARIAALEPDVLVLSGAPIVPPAIFDIPTHGTVNVHFGISPEYRGEHTLFQALANHDHDHVGLTIHQVDAGVDTGAVVARVYPALSPSDDEASLRAACARLGATVLVQYLQAVAAGSSAHGPPQTGEGRLYRLRDHTVRRDVRYWVSRNLLRRRAPHRAPRVDHFLHVPEAPPPSAPSPTSGPDAAPTSS